MTGHVEYPFTAIVGQELAKTALMINAVCPDTMGVLLLGPKGTAKSSIARSFAHLLPSEKNVPFLTLPINATEDNLVGSIDFEKTLKTGNKHFLPGLFAKVHQGVLYIDEINLLDDHLVDLILDTASSGINRVEREGISCSHPSSFILIGTMNPEEGGLRPQLLDRFGLCVHVKSLKDPKQRVDVMIQHEAFQNDPIVFYETWRKKEEIEKKRIAKAAAMFASVNITEKQLTEITHLCRDVHAAGHRGDLIIARASKAIAAYMGRPLVEDSDIRMAAMLALPHRAVIKSDGQNASAREKPDNTQDPGGHPSFHMTNNMRQKKGLFNLHSTRQAAQAPQSSGKTKQRISGNLSGSEGGLEDYINHQAAASAGAELNVFEIGKMVKVVVGDMQINRQKAAQTKNGRRYQTPNLNKKGKYKGTTFRRLNNDIAIEATLRAAAPYQKTRVVNKSRIINIEPQDIREKLRRQKKGAFLVFVVDASGSIGAKLMSEAKGAIFYLLNDAYIKRDKVCMIAFRDTKATMVLPPTNSIMLAKNKLEILSSGGKTPLCDGILKGYKTITNHMYQDKGLLPMMIIITDGRANVSVNPQLCITGSNTLRLYDELFAMAGLINKDKRIQSIVIDVSKRTTGMFMMAEQMARYMGARYIPLEDIRSESIIEAVRSSETI